MFSCQQLMATFTGAQNQRCHVPPARRHYGMVLSRSQTLSIDADCCLSTVPHLIQAAGDVELAANDADAAGDRCRLRQDSCRRTRYVVSATFSSTSVCRDTPCDWNPWRAAHCRVDSCVRSTDAALLAQLHAHPPPAAQLPWTLLLALYYFWQLMISSKLAHPPLAA